MRWLLLVGLAFAACSSEDARSAPVAPPSSVDPDAMCDEHGVLLALCTKHNPSLVAVFRARGDFCEEHGFAESICPICHPERGGRPTVALGATPNVPAEGDVVVLRDADSAERAGLSLAEVVARSEPVREPATARIAYDARGYAIINARAPGVVTALEVDVGERVTAGQPLAILESAEAGSLSARLAAARERVAAAQQTSERLGALQSEGIASARSATEARAELATARADVAAASSSLRMLGPSAGRARYVVASPIAGTVIARRATIGHFADPEDVLFEVVDTSHLWVELEVPETAAATIAIGATAVVTIEGLDEPLNVTIEHVAPEIDPRSRTVLARAPIANPEGRLRAHMIGDAQVEVAPARDGVFVPRSAVQHARDHDFVFVPRSATSFEVRRVRIASRAGELVEIEGRLRAGERVVDRGAFLLLAEALPDALGAGCCAE